MSTSLVETGQRYGRLVVVSHCGNRTNGSAVWLCRCDCGTEKIVYARNLRSGATQSCGCLAAERSRERMTESYWRRITATNQGRPFTWRGRRR